MKEKVRKYLLMAAGALSWSVIALAAAVLLYAGCRIFVCDQFVIPTDSMSPTLIPGDRILANKLIFGARIYRNYDFSDGEPLESWRMPGLRKIRPNDILVFNAPNGYDRGKIEFKINYVFSKRCVGTPGDSVSIVNGIFRNNRYEGTIGQAPEQQRLAATPDSLIPGFIMNALPFDGRWSIKEFGPLYVPARGDTLRLDPSVYGIYKNVIEYETGGNLTVKDGVFLLDNAYISEYIFTENYYFACGDNVIDSSDSRYWGFVPEEFIIGVAGRISYSRDRYTGKLRRDRLWKKVEI